jgi:hypothetical protein
MVDTFPTRCIHLHLLSNGNLETYLLAEVKATREIIELNHQSTKVDLSYEWYSDCNER